MANPNVPRGSGEAPRSRANEAVKLALAALVGFAGNHAYWVLKKQNVQHAKDVAASVPADKPKARPWLLNEQDEKRRTEMMLKEGEGRQLWQKRQEEMGTARGAERHSDFEHRDLWGDPFGVRGGRAGPTIQMPLEEGANPLEIPGAFKPNAVDKEYQEAIDNDSLPLAQRLKLMFRYNGPRSEMPQNKAPKEPEVEIDGPPEQNYHRKLPPIIDLGGDDSDIPQIPQERARELRRLSDEIRWHERRLSEPRKDQSSH